MNYSGFTKNGLRNAEFFLTKIVEGKPGESIVFIANEFTYPETELMAICSKKLGMKPVVIDLSVYGINWFQKEDFTYNPAIRACIEAADICVTTCMSFGKLLGSSKAMDGILTGKQRCFAYWAHFMQEWEFDQYQVLMAHKRPLPLRKLIEKSHVLHLTTAKGTDITCQVGLENMNSIYEVCAIVPFFSEVAIIPKFGTVSGVAVVDGASSRFYGEDSVALRTNDFGNRDLQLGPTIMTFEKGVLTKLEGHPVHTERIEKWMNSFTPVANHVDEVGLVTCTDRINDDYQWRVFNDGSHHSNSFHIALGNNVNEREEIVHAKAHCDFDIWNPTMELDGHIIYKDGKFDDEYIFVQTGYELPEKF